MKQRLSIAVLTIGVTVLAGCSASETAASPEGDSTKESAVAEQAKVEPPAPAPKREVTIPGNTRVRIRTASTISTKTAQAGEAFSGVLAEPLVVDGITVAKEGADVKGLVASSDDGGRVKGVASLSLKLTGIEIDGETVAIESNLFVKNAPATKKKDAIKVGIGAGIGAAVGAIAGGGKGAGIGAASGAGAGTAVVLATKGDPAVVDAESVVSFRLKSPVTVEID